MQFDPRLEFSSKKVRTTILPPMTCKGPIRCRKYTVYNSRITCEYFLTIADEFCKENLNQLLRDEIFGRWDQDDNGIYRLKLYVNLGNENKFIVLARYAMFKQLIPDYIQTILHGDREFFRENRCLLNSQVTVRFMSGCETFNMVEPYGTLKNYHKRY